MFAQNDVYLSTCQYATAQYCSYNATCEWQAATTKRASACFRSGQCRTTCFLIRGMIMGACPGCGGKKPGKEITWDCGQLDREAQIISVAAICSHSLKSGRICGARRQSFALERTHERPRQRHVKVGARVSHSATLSCCGRTQHLSW